MEAEITKLMYFIITQYRQANVGGGSDTRCQDLCIEIEAFLICHFPYALKFFS